MISLFVHTAFSNPMGKHATPHPESHNAMLVKDDVSSETLVMVNVAQAQAVLHTWIRVVSVLLYNRPARAGQQEVFSIGRTCSSRYT